MGSQSEAWRCAVCGYIHRGPEAPAVCPVCGVSKDEFEPHEDQPKPDEGVATGRWRCVVCDYIHDGTSPPDECPVCGALSDSFEPVGEQAPPAAETASESKLLIIGAGIAGIAAVEAIRMTSPSVDITLVAKEPELPYYRLNLTRYLAGEIGAEVLPIHEESWYSEHNVQLLRGAEGVAVRLEDRVLELKGGERLQFDKLLLATGAHAFIPPFPGADREGVTALRTLSDADYILDAIGTGAKCVCIGGGILGLETAAALKQRGADVTLLEGHGWLLPRQLNERAGNVLAEHVVGREIQLRRNARTQEIVGDNRVSGVRLEDGELIPADVVVVATGIRPNSYLARRAELTVNRGVVVDDTLQTSHPDILAAGDVAEHRGVIYGTWGPSQYQGSIAGMNMLGNATEFGGIPRSNTLKVLGVDLFSIGQTTAEDASFEVIGQQRGGHYTGFVFRDNLLVGAILLGDSRLSTRVKKAIEEREDFSGVLQKHPTAEHLTEHLRTDSQ